MAGEKLTAWFASFITNVVKAVKKSSIRSITLLARMCRPANIFSPGSLPRTPIIAAIERRESCRNSLGLFSGAGASLHNFR